MLFFASPVTAADPPRLKPFFRGTPGIRDESRKPSRPYNPEPGATSNFELTPARLDPVRAAPVPPATVHEIPAGLGGETSPAPAREQAMSAEEMDIFGETTTDGLEPELPQTTPEPGGEVPDDNLTVLIPEQRVPYSPEPRLYEGQAYAGQNQPAPPPPGSLDDLLKFKKQFGNPGYALGRERQGLPPNTEARPDRWRLGFEPWKRYDDTRIESTYQKASAPLWHPYRQSLLKGDIPILGQDYFLSLTAASQTTFEARRLPTPSGISGAQPDNAEFYGRGSQWFVRNDISLLAEFFKGETAFKPVTWSVRVQGVYNFNALSAQETGVVSADPRGPIRSVPDTSLKEFDDPGGSPLPNNTFVRNPADVLRLLSKRITPKPGRGRTAQNDLGQLGGLDNTERFDDFFGLQQAFLEIHLTDLTPNYDFISSRIGLQQFISDFRGFIFNDTNLGIRIFGNFDNNRWQANLAAFDMREKDSNSELNTFRSRHQYVLAANVYRQDTFFTGYTTQLSLLANLDESSTYYDTNGFIRRPAPLGDVAPHDVNAFYIGFSGEGHIGWLNISHSLYQVLGRDQFNGIAGREVDINAQMTSLELSIDKDWIRYKFSAFYASGDDDALDGEARGFDSINDNPFFLNSPFSYFTRQGFNLGGSAVGLKQRDSLLPNLRTTKFEGQSNFVNPGVLAFGLGADLEITPRLRASVQANYLRFDDTDSIKRILFTDQVDREIGIDLSVGIIYRPLLTNNIIISAGVGVLIPGKGFRDIYRTSTRPVEGYRFNEEDAGDIEGDFLYSGLIVLTATF